MKGLLIKLAFCCLLASCASNGPPPNALPAGNATSVEAAEPAPVDADLTLQPIVVSVRPAVITGDQIVCSEEAVTGTHQVLEVCESRAARERQRRSAQEWLRTGGFSGGGTVVSSGRRR